MKIEITPLQAWIAAKIGLSKGEVPDAISLEKYQLTMLRKTLDLARQNSPFYRHHLRKIDPHDLNSMEDIALLPFTFPHDLAAHGLQMLCVSQGEIARIITLQTSGTTACPKRIYFTKEDLELTADFFAHGMKALVKPGQRVMVLMPGVNYGSVGERVKSGLAEINCHTFVHGFVDDPRKIIEKINTLGIDCLIGLPAQVLSLARWPQKIDPGRIKSVLLSGDYLPESLVKAIKKSWNCPVFNHYGLTETGLGGGVECQAQSGCHLREADLFLEIVDRKGRPLPAGEEGEIVITTLTRTGMPLIRYRTGDISRFITSRCACGSKIKRLDRVRGRSSYRVGQRELGLDDMDEAIFKIDDIVDFEVTITQQKEIHLMDIKFWSVPDKGFNLIAIEEELYKIPAVKQLMDDGILILNNICSSHKKLFSNPIKRKIKVIQDAQKY